MNDLIDRLEKATGPDRELDVAIVCALHPDIGPYQPHCRGEEPIFWNDPYRKQPCPKFTASIDAAMTLLPPLDDTLRPLTILMGVSENGLRFQVVLKNWRWGAIKSNDRCASYPLALCDAALRARASTPPSHQLRTPPASAARDFSGVVPAKTLEPEPDAGGLSQHRQEGQP